MGRVTTQNGRKYTWNLASQLTAFSDGVNSATFAYDGLGEVNASTFSGSAQTFVYNYLLHFPALSISPELRGHRPALLRVLPQRHAALQH